MNTSRDIEKLFDQFGGNATDYQEIGRETEARTARTRWPLLATLDFSQPSIPDIVHRDPLAPATPHARPGESGATPIARAKLPLFARAHRRTIPPVANVALPAVSVGAARFSALAESVEIVSQAVQPHDAIPAVPAVVKPAAALPRATEAASAFLASRSPAPRASLPRFAPAATSEATQEVSKPAVTAAPSILGKLFQTPPEASPAPTPASEPRSSSLQSVFERLRAPAAPADAPVESFSWVASRAPRS